MVSSFRSLRYISKVPRCARVAPLTNREVIAAKRTLPVMTGYAALTATSCVMVKWRRRRDLSSLRHPPAHLVAFIASNLLMLGMAKSHAEAYGQFTSARITTQLMTRGA
jgi:hypothetical protein